jgi:hypothetical protein
VHVVGREPTAVVAGADEKKTPGSGAVEVTVAGSDETKIPESGAVDVIELGSDEKKTPESVTVEVMAGDAVEVPGEIETKPDEASIDEVKGSDPEAIGIVASIAPVGKTKPFMLVDAS